ncbi:MAG: FecR family protein, partial [Sphingomonas sp.]|uniref:FecR domain-containing protein n=1 Tax=Sphingomonas sp. TaxID=28214 RepID=UPI00356446B1
MPTRPKGRGANDRDGKEGVCMLRATGIAAALAGLLITTSAFAQTGPWMISEANGQVVVRDGSGEHAATRGMTVSPGSTVLTGAGGRAVIVRDRDFVTISANARMRVPAPAATASPGLFQLIQEWGNAVFRIEHRPTPHFGVQAPYLAAVVKGTTFSITVAREGTSLQVIEGAVEAATSDGGAHELVRPGTVATVMAADRFRLSVQGQGAHFVDSPQRGSDPAPGTPSQGSGSGDMSATAPVSPTTSPAVATGARVIGDDDIKWGDVSASMIAAPIEAKPVDIGKLTGGLVGGGGGYGAVAIASVATATHSEVSALGKSDAASGNGGANGTGSSGSGNGGGTGTGNSGTGNGGGAGTGNPNTGNGGGTGTGNPGNGGGNGTGNPGNGNGGGTGTGNPGNGNGGGTDTGNPGNGNGGGTDTGNPGNGNGGGTGTGNPGNGSGGGTGTGNPGNGDGGGNGTG